MAAPNRILSLNLGLQTVGLAEFRTTQSGGLVLQSYRLTELVADPAADATRPSQMEIATKEMLEGLKIKKGKVNYAISAQSVFTRFVKLPPVDASQVDQIITFEAQQNVPFPINEVVWDYQLVGGGSDDNKLEVVLVAIKADLLDDLNAAVEGSGLRANVVDVAPMALYNAFRYNYSDFSGCSLLIDIGARTTNLIFVDSKKVFSRSIPIGGSTITAGIAKDFNEPMGAAEERKKKTGFVSLGGAYAEPADPEVSRVSKIIRNTMTRLHAEISRSISFYRSQQQGNPPARVFLCGGSSGLPYMREFFQEKLQLPIEFFNALRNVSVSNQVNQEEAGRNAHALGELVGLSLRSVTDCPMELNLQPAEVEKAKLLARKRPYIITAGICALLILAGFWAFYWKAAEIEQGVLDNLQPRVASLQNFANQFETVTKDLKAKQDNSQPLLGAVSDREYWVKIIDDLNARLPEKYIWITSFEPGWFSPDGRFTPSKGGQDQSGSQVKSKFGVQIRGLYLDVPGGGVAMVDGYANNLKQSPYFDVDPQKRRTTSTGNDWGYEYELRLYLKKSPSLQ
jgi:type IV pilus assembly protein PilM